MSIVWIILIGFIAGIIARWISPLPNNPSGFLMTSILGIAGAFVATFLGRWVGWYGAEESAGLISAIVGAVLVLAIYNALIARSAAYRPKDQGSGGGSASSI
jgi:uncharacterized membrane protein YeaQ/YmgE (transglycosylase-associated protein family)